MIGDEQLLVKNKMYYLQFKFFNHITKLRFTCKNNKIKIHKLRMHYFFSMNNDINNTLKQILVDVRITSTDKWDSAIFMGKSMSLYEFMSEYCPLRTVLIPRGVSLFSADILNYLTLQVIYISF